MSWIKKYLKNRRLRKIRAERKNRSSDTSNDHELSEFEKLKIRYRELEIELETLKNRNKDWGSDSRWY